MLECIVCGARTRQRVTVLGLYEVVLVCRGSCRKIFLRYPLTYLGANLIEIGEVRR